MASQQSLRKASKHTHTHKKQELTSISCGQMQQRHPAGSRERKLQESYKHINNAPEAPLPTKPVMIWDTLTIIHTWERERNDVHHSGYQNPVAKCTGSTKGGGVDREPFTWQAYLTLAAHPFKTYAYHMHAVARHSRVHLSVTLSGLAKGYKYMYARWRRARDAYR